MGAQEKFRGNVSAQLAQAQARLAEAKRKQEKEVPPPEDSSSEEISQDSPPTSAEGLPAEDATFKVIAVTPELAKKWLGSNAAGQRSIRRAVVDSYANDMAAGKWKLLPQMIIFDENGVLVDGQHRLSAVVLSKQTVKMWVAAAPGVSVHDALDRGANRSIADLLQWHGSKVSTAVNLYRLITMGFDNKRVTKDEVLLAYEATREHFDAVHPRLHRQYLPSSVAAACIFARPISEADVDEFVTRVRSGAEMQEGDPALTFRNWVLGSNRNYRNRGGDPMTTCFGALMGLKHFIEGVPLKSVYVGPTGYRWVCVRRRGLGIPNTPTALQLPESKRAEELFPKRLAGKGTALKEKERK